LAVFGLAASPFDQAAYLAGSMASIAQPSRATWADGPSEPARFA
jgi:hypothetical protein